jgi:prolyl-tRNA editing enzyme YbaK/EbsC (Cys-tRNA(Pro) deacylase)
MSNAVTLLSARLQELGVTGKIVEFDDAVPTAATAAEQLGCELGAIANSLIFRFSGEPLLVVASGAHRVDTQRVADLLGVPAIRRADPEFVLTATGQPVGGVAPVGHPAPVRTIVDRALQAYPAVWAGGGTKHAMFPTTFDELVRITEGVSADVGD